MRAITETENPSVYFTNRAVVFGFRCVPQKPYTLKPYTSRLFGHAWIVFTAVETIFLYIWEGSAEICTSGKGVQVCTRLHGSTQLELEYCIGGDRRCSDAVLQRYSNSFPTMNCQSTCLGLHFFVITIDLTSYIFQNSLRAPPVQYSSQIFKVVIEILNIGLNFAKIDSKIQKSASNFRKIDNKSRKSTSKSTSKIRKPTWTFWKSIWIF